MRISSSELVNKALSEIRTLSVDEALDMHGQDDVQFVDLRDVRELQREGRVPGAFHAPRGLLEFWIDPESEYAKPVFQEDKTFIFFCAAGMRSALATKTAKDMGMSKVAHIEGGFSAWRKRGGAVEMPEPRSKK